MSIRKVQIEELQQAWQEGMAEIGGGFRFAAIRYRGT